MDQGAALSYFRLTAGQKLNGVLLTGIKYNFIAVTRSGVDM
jgi:hypothetical protein